MTSLPSKVVFKLVTHKTCYKHNLNKNAVFVVLYVGYIHLQQDLSQFNMSAYNSYNRAFVLTSRG